MSAALVAAYLGWPEPPATRTANGQPRDDRPPGQQSLPAANGAVDGHGGGVAGESSNEVTATGDQRVDRVAVAKSLRSAAVVGGHTFADSQMGYCDLGRRNLYGAGWSPSGPTCADASSGWSGEGNHPGSEGR